MFLYDWLKPNADQIMLYISQMTKTIDFLRENNIIHLETHRGNILSDGNNFYLTDFGLVLDMEFELTKQEKNFYKKNDCYDYVTIISNIKTPLLSQLFAKKEYFNKKFFGEKIIENEFYGKLYENLDEICECLKYDKTYVELLKKYCLSYFL